ncbi:MAG TPA: sigma-70 family RNA polymerase sigma factor [Gaiellaceae bacterium]|nr:sigma-70 family RNA polymerase sigma factor [Gaiellaceae bacterium]
MSTAVVSTGLPFTAAAATMPTVAVIQPTDEDLLARVAEGDRDAFGDLYRRYARAVLGLALRRLGDRGRAEDAVQEAFASVWRAARSYRRERGPVAPWLYAVARNAIADRGRARIEPAAEPVDQASGEPGPADHAEHSWVAWRVHSALQQLPETERTVLELAYWGELSQSEIASFLGIPLGTVKTRTRSGLRRLADELDDLEAPR